MANSSMTLPRKPKPLAADEKSGSRSAPEGSPADLEALFHQQWSRLCAALYRFTGDPAEAEDLAMEAFVQLWQRPPANTDNLGGWLYRVATRLGLNRLRAAARRGRYELNAGRDDLAPATLDDPENETGRRQERARVRAVLAEMDERQARLLLLRHAGFSYQEIAAALELNPASIGTLLARAEQAFSKAYEKEDEVGGDHASERI
jgi:RNA polymerase sigma-70 factor, ECF subfamily